MPKRGESTERFVLLFREALVEALNKCPEIGVDPSGIIVEGGNNGEGDGIWEQCLSRTVLTDKEIPMASDLGEGNTMTIKMGGGGTVDISPSVVILGCGKDARIMVPNIDIKGRNKWEINIDWRAGNIISISTSKDGIWSDLPSGEPCETTLIMDNPGAQGQKIRKESSSHYSNGERWDPEEGKPAHLIFGENGAVERQYFYINGFNRRKDTTMPAGIFTEDNGRVTRKIYCDKFGQLHREPSEGFAVELFGSDGKVDKKASSHYFEGNEITDKQARRLSKMVKGGKPTQGAVRDFARAY